jgi:ankyrin repeat protein
LHGAVMKGSLAIVEFLLARGANLDAINAKKLRPLDIAMGQPGLGIVANPTLVELLSSKQNN